MAKERLLRKVWVHYLTKPVHGILTAIHVEPDGQVYGKVVADGSKDYRWFPMKEIHDNGTD